MIDDSSMMNLADLVCPRVGATAKSRSIHRAFDVSLALNHFSIVNAFVLAAVSATGHRLCTERW
jgi:hypothetical protein